MSRNDIPTREFNDPWEGSPCTPEEVRRRAKAVEKDRPMAFGRYIKKVELERKVHPPGSFDARALLLSTEYEAKVGLTRYCDSKRKEREARGPGIGSAGWVL